MTIDQAVAILQAEQVLQDEGRDGPDSAKGTAWNDYVREAASVVKDDRLCAIEARGLHLLEEYDD